MALLSGGAFAALTAQSSLAQAQTVAANTATPSTSLEEVVVTGSRIATPNLDSISPVTAVTSEEIKQTGTVRIEDLINSLPQVVADQGSGLSMGSNGTATINLRGLGSQRTLVLVNGRRLQGGDPGASFGSTPAFASAADINQIPVALVERVDVLTGGASSTYGADAVAGVVNFVMNDHFEGVRLDANAGIYNHSNHEGWINDLVKAKKFPSVTGTNWDGNNKDLTLIMGHNFADGAGNFEGYLGYRRTGQATADHRDHAACQLSRGSTSSSPFSCGGSSTSSPTVFENPTDNNLKVQINPDGTLGPRYARFNYAASHYLQRNDERYTAGFYGKLKFNDHAEAYTEFSFMDDQTRGNYAPAGSFLGSGKAIDRDSNLPDGALSYNCGVGGYGNPGMNPYITAGEFPTLCPGVTYTNSQNAAAAIKYAPYQFNAATGIGQILVGRRNVEGGPRQDNYEHITYRGVFGIRGEVVSNWTYDAYGLFARTSSSDFHNNDTSTSRFQNALLAVPGPGGTPVCSGGEAGCVPWNIFNPAIPVSKAALAYFALPGIFNASNEEDIASAFVSGDLTSYGLKTPWADSGLKVVLGTEYRRDILTVQPDAEFQTGDLAGQGSPAPPVEAAQHVWEAFTEARMPVFHDMPFAKTLDVEGGYRYSNYTEGYSTSTFKLGVEWAPFSDIRVRASYNRAVRAPNLQELFQPQHVGLDAGGDSCVGGAKSGLTQAECALLGVSAASYAAGGPASSPAQQYNGLIGGNPNIQPEVAKTRDIGIVFTPSFLPGFNATLDYTDIRITNLVNTYGPNTVQANCVATGSPVWCNLVHRDAGGTLWASLNGYTTDPILNEGGLEYKGVDIGLAYKIDVGAAGRIRTRLDGTYLLNLINRPGLGTAFQGKPYDCAGQFGPDCAPVTPKWRHRMTIDYDTPITGLSAGLTWRFFGAAQNESLNSRYPGYQPGVAASSKASGIPVADGHIPTMEYLDLRVAYQWNNITARLGVNNVADKDPPVIDTGNSGGNSIYAESNTYPSVYDTLGRYLFLNVTVDF